MVSNNKPDGSSDVTHTVEANLFAATMARIFPDSNAIAQDTNGQKEKSTKKQIQGIWAGGTIGSVVAEVIDGEEICKPGLTGREFNKKLSPSIHSHFKIHWHTPEHFNKMGIDSTNIHHRQIIAIAQKIYDLLRIPAHEGHGILVAHGSDSLEETAFGLSMMLQNLDRPIVITGAQIYPDNMHSDHNRNVALALEVMRSRFGEVCVGFHQTVFRGASVTKTHAIVDRAFGSNHQSPIGQLSGKTIDFTDKNNLIPVKAPDSPLMYFPGLSGETTIIKMRSRLNNPDALLKAAEGYEGIIIEGMAAGNIPEDLTSTFEKIAKEAVVIVTPRAATEGKKETKYGVSAEVSLPNLISVKMDSIQAEMKFMWLHACGTKLRLSGKDLLDWVRSRFRVNYVREVVTKDIYPSDVKNELLTSKYLFENQVLVPEVTTEKDIMDYCFDRRIDWLYKKGRLFGLNHDLLDKWVNIRKGLLIDMRTIEGTWEAPEFDQLWRVLDTPALLASMYMPERHTNGVYFYPPIRKTTVIAPRVPKHLDLPTGEETSLNSDAEKLFLADEIVKTEVPAKPINGSERIFPH